MLRCSSYRIAHSCTILTQCSVRVQPPRMAPRPRWARASAFCEHDSRRPCLILCRSPRGARRYAEEAEEVKARKVREDIRRQVAAAKDAAEVETRKAKEDIRRQKVAAEVEALVQQMERIKRQVAAAKAGVQCGVRVQHPRMPPRLSWGVSKTRSAMAAISSSRAAAKGKVAAVNAATAVETCMVGGSLSMVAAVAPLLHSTGEGAAVATAATATATAAAAATIAAAGTTVVDIQAKVVVADDRAAAAVAAADADATRLKEEKEAMRAMAEQLEANREQEAGYTPNPLS